MNSRPQVQRRTRLQKVTRFAGDGVLILDKPAGLTSHDLVQQVKRKLGAAKVGHGGTLDPFATGVLVLLVNEATKLSPYLANEDKGYRFTVVFGIETDTQDSTGRVVARHHCAPLQETQIREACAAFVGEIRQVVPRYSAVRVGGQRLYHLARQGVQVAPPSRRVRIESLDLLELRWPEATFETTCSKGTYVRTLGAELGRYLHCGGHVCQLRRVHSGSFHLGQAVTLAQLEEIVARGELEQVLIPPAQTLRGYSALRVSHLGARRVRQGVPLEQAEPLDESEGEGWPEGLYRVIDPDDQLVALVARSRNAANNPMEEETTFKTLRVFGTL